MTAEQIAKAPKELKKMVNKHIKQKKISLNQFGKECGVQVTRLRSWLGNTSEITTGTMARIAEYLKEFEEN